MQNTTEQMPAMQGEVGYLLGMIWVLMLMLPVVVAFVGKKTNERKMRSVGFELEVIKTAHKDSEDANHSLAVWLTKMGVKSTYDGYTHEVKDTTKIVTDGSLSSGGIEIVSPPLVGTKARRNWLSKVGKAVAGLVSVNTTCGVHHHEQIKSDDSTLREDQERMGRIAFIYGAFQHAINQLLPNSRRNNSYARKVDFLLNELSYSATSMDIYEQLYNHGSGRYLAVNPHSYGDYGTIEFRQHGGSYNAVKLDAWSQICGAIVSRAWNMQDEDLITLHKLWKGNNFGRNLQVSDLLWYLGFSERSNLGAYAVKRASVLRGVIQSENCPNCGKLTCAGCQTTTTHNWDEVHNQKPRHSQVFGSVREMTRVISLNLPTPYQVQFVGATVDCPNCNASHGDGEGLSVQWRHLSVTHFSGYTATVRAVCGYCRDQVVMPAGTLRITRFNLFTEETELLDIDNDEFYDERIPSVSEAFRHGFSAIGLGLVSVALSLAPAVIGIMLLVGCGIGAIHGAGKPFNNRNRFKQLFVALKERGSEASGFAWCIPTKPKTHLYVKAAKSSEVMAHNIRKHLSNETLAVIGHTRFATHGDNNKANAHPHFSSNSYVCLVHNGVVHNHDDVWTALKRKPTGPVDSQAIAEALEVGGIEEVVKHCEGSMSLIWMDFRDPQGTLKFWTNGGNPLSFGRLDRNSNDEGKNGGAVAVASTTALLTKSMGKRLKKHWECVVGREYTVNPDGTMTNRDIEGSSATAGFTYDWRTYARTVGMYSKRTKTTGRKVRKNKATGNADNCTLPSSTHKYDSWGNIIPPTRVKYVTDEDTNTIYALMDKSGSWPSFIGERGVECHGYDSVTHQGITPDGDYYHIPAYLQMFTHSDQMKRFLNGDYAELKNHYPSNNFAKEWAHAGKWDEHWR